MAFKLDHLSEGIQGRKYLDDIGIVELEVFACIQTYIEVNQGFLTGGGNALNARCLKVRVVQQSAGQF